MRFKDQPSERSKHDGASPVLVVVVVEVVIVVLELVKTKQAFLTLITSVYFLKRFTNERGNNNFIVRWEFTQRDFSDCYKTDLSIDKLKLGNVFILY